MRSLRFGEPAKRFALGAWFRGPLIFPLGDSNTRGRTKQASLLLVVGKNQRGSVFFTHKSVYPMFAGNLIVQLPEGSSYRPWSLIYGFHPSPHCPRVSPCLRPKNPKTAGPGVAAGAGSGELHGVVEAGARYREPARYRVAASSLEGASKTQNPCELA